MPVSLGSPPSRACHDSPFRGQAKASADKESASAQKGNNEDRLESLEEYNADMHKDGGGLHAGALEMGARRGREGYRGISFCYAYACIQGCTGDLKGVRGHEARIEEHM